MEMFARRVFVFVFVAFLWVVTIPQLIRFSQEIDMGNSETLFFFRQPLSDVGVPEPICLVMCISLQDLA